MKSKIVISKSAALLEGENILIIYKQGTIFTCKLEPQLKAILLKLVHSKDSVVTKEDFITSIWTNTVFVGQTALRKNIYKLRNLIKNNGLDDELSIETIPKIGYKLSISENQKRPFIDKKKPKISKLIYASITAAVILLLIALRFSTEEDIIIQVPSSEIKITSNQN